MSRENPSQYLRRFEAERFGLHSALIKQEEVLKEQFPLKRASTVWPGGIGALEQPRPGLLLDLRKRVVDAV